MLRRLLLRNWRHCSLPAVKLEKSVQPSPLLLPPLLLHHSTTTTTTTTEQEQAPTPPSRYDPNTYHLPFTPSEAAIILNALNTATPHKLACYGVGKGLGARLLRHKQNRGFADISDLLEVDGVGIKSAEKLCRKLLDGNGGGGEGVLASPPPLSSSAPHPPYTPGSAGLVNPKRLVKPRLNDKLVKNIHTFTALHITAGFLSWVQCGRDGCVLELGTHSLLTPNTRFDTLRIYEKVRAIVNSLPVSDLYVCEERAGHSHLAKAPLGTVIVALQLAQIRGMLMALLEGRKRGVKGQRHLTEEEEEEEEEEEKTRHTSLFFLKDSVVPRLFKLKMGNDRLPSLNTADTLMDGSGVGGWLSHLPVSPEARETYFAATPTERRYTGTAVLVAVAFCEAVVRRNDAVLRLLSQ